MPFRRVTIYADDDVTVLAVINSDPAAANSYLLDSPKYGDASIDFVEGKASIGQFVFRALDKRITATNQATGWLTQLISTNGGLIGNRVVVEKQRAGSATYYREFDGTIQEHPLDPETLVTYTFPCRDIRERERNSRAFTTLRPKRAGADIGAATTLMPYGVEKGYGKNVAGVYLIPPAVPLIGVFWRDPTIPTLAGRIKFSITVNDIRLHYDRYLMYRSRFGAPRHLYDAAGKDLGMFFTGVTIKWRPYPGGGAWNIFEGAEMPVPTVANEYGYENIFHDDPRIYEIAEQAIFKGIAGRVNVVVNMTKPATKTLPTQQQQIEVLVLAEGVPDEEVALYIEDNAGQFLQDLWDGVYSSYAMGVRYNAAALTTMKARTPTLRFIAKEVEKDPRGFIEKSIYKPLGYAPQINDTGEIAPLKWELPDVSAPLLAFDNSNTREDAKWGLHEQDAVNVISFRTIHETLRPAVDNYDLPLFRLMEQDIIDDDGVVSSIKKLGLKELVYEPKTIRTLDPYGRFAPFTQNLAERLRAERIAQVRDRFTFGGQRVTAYRLRSATGTAGAQEGDWATVTLSWLPNFATGTRGIDRLMQIVRILEDDEVWRGFELLDAGPSSAPSAQPTVGAPTVSAGVVTIPVTAVAAGVAARVDIFVGAAEPASDSGSWQFAGRVTAAGNITVGPFPGGLTAFVRARGEEIGKRRSGWTATQTVAIGSSVVVNDVVVKFDPDGTVRVFFVPAEGAVGVRIYYDVHTANPDFTGISTANYFDAAATGGAAGVALPAGATPNQAQDVAVRVDPYTAFPISGGTVGTISPVVIAHRFTYAEVLLPVAQELTSTAGMVGTLTLSIADPQGRLTKVEFSHQSGDGAWSAWVQDTTVPYSDAVALLESKTSKVAYRITGYDANGDINILNTMEVSFSMGAAPTIPSIQSASYDSSGNLTVVVQGDERTVSILGAAVTGVDPTITQIRAGTGINSRYATYTFGPVANDADVHFGFLAYTGTNGSGTESQPARGSLRRPAAVPAQVVPPIALIYPTNGETDDTVQLLTFDYVVGSGGGGTNLTYVVYQKLGFGAETTLYSGNATTLPRAVSIARHPRQAKNLRYRNTDTATGKIGEETWTIPPSRPELNDTGNPYRTRQYDDGDYPARSTTTTGSRLHSGIDDSRGYVVNTHYNTGQHNADDIGVGGISRVMPYSVIRASDNALLSVVDYSAKIGNQNAANVSKSTQGLFFNETWDSLGIWGAVGTIVAGGNVGGNVLRVTNYQWQVYPYTIPFNPAKLYRLKVRYRCTQDATVGGNVYIGLQGYDSAGAVTNNNGGYNYVAVGGDIPTVAQGWKEVTTYVKGATSAYTSSSAGASTDPLAPSDLRVNTVGVRPHWAFNYGGGNGIYEFDYYQITEIDEDASFRTYSVASVGGNLKRGRLWDDSYYGVRAGTSDGARINTGTVYDQSSGQYTDNAFYRSTHTLTNTIDGGARYAAVEGGANKTETRTSLNTTNVDSIAATTARDYANRAGGALDSTNLLLAASLIRSRGFSDGLFGLRSGSADGRILTVNDPYFSDTSQYVSSAYQRNYHTLTNTTDGGGRFAAPVANASSDLPALITTGTAMVVAGNSVSGGDNSSWSSQAYSREGYVLGAYVTWKSTAAAYFMMGLNTDPATDASYASIDYCIFCHPNGNLYAYESGGGGYLLSAYDATTVMTVSYDGTNIRYLVNGAVIRTVRVDITAPLYLDSSFLYGTASNIKFGPLSSNNWTNVAGTGRPVNYADVTASNTSYDTSRVNTVAAATVQDYANRAGTTINASNQFLRTTLNSDGYYSVRSNSSDGARIGTTSVYDQTSGQWTDNGFFRSTHSLDSVIDGGTFKRVTAVNASSQITPSSAITRYTCRAQISVGQSIAVGTLVVLNFGGELYDTPSNNLHDTASLTSRITIPSDGGFGNWLLIAEVGWPYFASGYRQIEIIKNGGTQGIGVDTQNNTASAAPSLYQRVVGLADNPTAGDWFEVRVKHNGSAAQSIAIGTFWALHIW